jgi:hypothetical protein
MKLKIYTANQFDYFINHGIYYVLSGKTNAMFHLHFNNKLRLYKR